jgi:hypothetical protein
MNGKLLPVLLGLFAGLSVYSSIGWAFARKTPEGGRRYLVLFFLSLAVLIGLLIWR